MRRSWHAALAIAAACVSVGLASVIAGPARAATDPAAGPAATTYSTAGQLAGVATVSNSSAWAVGYAGRSSAPRVLMLHWNGTAWSLVTLPNAGGEGSQLFGVAALSAGDVWAVGHTQESDGAILTLGEHFNGTAWSIVPTPDPGELGPLVDNGLLAAASPGNGTVWALGGQETLGECCQQTLGLQTTHG